MNLKTILYIIGGISVALLLIYIYYMVISIALNIVYPTATVIETVAVALIISWFMPKSIKK